MRYLLPWFPLYGLVVWIDAPDTVLGWYEVLVLPATFLIFWAVIQWGKRRYQHDEDTPVGSGQPVLSDILFPQARYGKVESATVQEEVSRQDRWLLAWSQAAQRFWRKGIWPASRLKS